ncbi:1,4-alpha-glucan branching protein GlgB [Liberiplasma polymorphum]|uniref:1,4-alpha-glucan branching protein GlgB n=1 Tax=Liberiplasma polymorphum TaxID=3374570 RepID=UPI0037713879
MEKMNQDTLYYFNQGLLTDAYQHFGAHLMKNAQGEVVKTRFTVYAPHAKEVSVVGEFNQFQNWVHQLTKVDKLGIWRIEIPENLEWKTYKYEIKTYDGRTLYKSDPYGYFSAERPDTVSKVYDIEGYHWQDHVFMENRHKKPPYHNQVSIYELHLGTWMTKPNGEFHRYNELVDLLIPYLKDQGYTHVEFMPIIEHPFDGSWGYQGTGYYASTSRFGVPKDLMYLIDQLHLNDIHVIFDWVPGHICKDAHGLYMFDGQPLYEYRDPFVRENIEWGTANLDLGRGETQSFLISNAMFWMKYFHVDGFRIDAVSNIIYYLGDARNGENQGAIQFLKKLSKEVFNHFPEAILAAEDSTAYPKVTHPVEFGGLGFNYKWNMGWMNDTLKYFEKDPIYRKYHHHELTFSLHYAFSENYILPLSHDEVVHGKKTLVEKMPGDYWQKFANYRALMGYFYTHPGKTLLFMGQEFGQMHEWRDYSELDWHLLKYPMHESALRFNKDFNLLIKHEKALYELDHEAAGFQWIDQHNADQSILSYIRYSHERKEHVVVVLNLTPSVYQSYTIGVPKPGTYKELINSDLGIYGGSNLYNGLPIKTSNEHRHGFEQSIEITLSPLAITVLKWSD